MSNQLHEDIHIELNKRYEIDSVSLDSLSKKQTKEANTSRRKNEVVPGRFYWPGKPLKGVKPNKSYNIDDLIDIVNKQWPKWKDVGIDVSIKKDGIRIIVHQDKEIKIYTEDGADITDKLPTIVKQLKEDKIVFEGELEWYHDGVHMNRSLTAGIIHQKKLSEFEPELFLSVYENLWHREQDLHSKSWKERKVHVGHIKDTRNIDIVKQHTVKTESALRKAVEKVSGESGCFLPGEKVFDGINFRNVEDVTSSEKMYSHNKFKQGINRVDSTDYCGLVYKIKPDMFFPFTVTKEHPIKIIKQNRLKNKLPFKWGYWYIKAFPNSKFNNIEEHWALPPELEKGDLLVLPKYKVFSSYQYKPVIYDDRFFEILGWYMAEGWTESNSSICFAINISEKEHLKNLLSLFFGTVREEDSQFSDKVVTLRVYNKELRSWLRKNFGKKSYEKRIPKAIMVAPGFLVRSFIKGYWLGDGCIKKDTKTKRKGMRFTSSSEQLMRQLQILLTKLDVLGNLSVMKRAGSEMHIRNKIYTQKDLYNLEVWGKQTENIIPTFEHNTKQHRKIYLETKDKFYVKVSSIEEGAWSGPIYNIETEDHFVYTPFLTHNSEGAYLKLMSGDYRLNKANRKAIKFKNVLVFPVLVLNRNELKGGSFNYDIGIKHKGKTIYMGKTFSTKQKFKKGDVIEVSGVNINKHTDKERNIVWFALFSPRIIQKSKKKAASLATLEKAVKITSGQDIKENAPVRIRKIVGDAKDQLVFLGTKGSTKEGTKEHKNDTSLLIDKGELRVIIGLGQTWKNKWQYLKPTHIILPNARRYGSWGLLRTKPDVPVLATKRVSNNMKQEYPFRRLLLKENQWNKIGELGVMPIPIGHSLKFSTDNFLIKFGDKKIAYLPHFYRFPNMDKALKDTFLLIGNGMSIKKDIHKKKGNRRYGVSSMRSQLLLANKLGIPNVIFTHLGKQVMKMDKGKLFEILRPYGKGLNVGFAEDNQPIVTEDKIRDARIEEIDLKTFNDQNPFMIYPDEKKKWRGVLQVHRRGKSVHGDLRMQIDKDTLVGLTLFIPKGLSKEPETFTESKKLIDKEIIPILKDKFNNPLKKTNMTKKSLQPGIWRKFSGRIEPGTVGATRMKSGDMHIVDTFDVERGANKANFNEFYFWGGKLLNGKYVARQIENKKEWKKTDEGLFTWFFFNADNQPYVISRGFKKEWMPPNGISALPRKYRKQVPKKFRWWEKDKGKKERGEFVKEFKTQIKSWVDQVQTISYELKHQTWKGPKQVRAGPTRHQWHLLLKDKEDVRLFTSEQNMETFKSVTGIFQPRLAKAMDKIEDGDVKPGTSINPTKATPSKIETIEKGSVKLLSDSKGFKRMIFKGRKVLKGVRVMVKEEGKSKVWTFRVPSKIGEQIEQESLEKTTGKFM